MVRKIFPNFEEEFEGKPLYDTLLVPTRLYYKDIHKVLEEVPVCGIAHITGGGLYENVPRIIPEGLCATIDESKINNKNALDAMKIPAKKFWKPKDGEIEPEKVEPEAEEADEGDEDENVVQDFITAQEFIDGKCWSADFRNWSFDFCFSAFFRFF